MKNMHKLIAKIRWCSVYLSVFVLMIQSVSAQNITRIEYFYDTDPGFGSGTSVSFTQSTDVSSLSFSANISSLSYGLHTLYIRSKDASNRWSHTNYQTFVRYQAPTGPSAAGNIVKLEYFLDTDPGFGLGTNVPVTAALDIANQGFSVNLVPLTAGLHTLYVRSKDANGKWSLTNYGTFVKYVAPTGGAAATSIVKIEYFLDTDPGFGAGTNVPVTAALDIPNTVFSVNLIPLTSGLHTIYVRTKDANGKWSLTNYGTFVKYVTPTGQPAAGNVVKMEYFLDADPGFGSGTNVPVTAAADIPNTVFSVNLVPLSGGLHTIYVRTKDSYGKWSLTNNGTFVKYVTQTGPAAAGAVTRIECFIDNDPGFGNGISLPFTHAANVSNLVSNINLTTLPNGFHTFYMRSMDTLGKWSLTNYGTFTGGSSVTRPTAIINTNGSDTFCFGAGTYLYATYTFSSTYQWQLNNANISGAINISYIPTQTGNYRVIVANSVGADTSATIHVLVNPIPTATISNNGPLTFCQGGSVGLSVNQTSGATYQWYLNGGTIGGATNSSYTANQSGSFYVTVSVLGGCSATSAHDTVVVNPIPSATITPNGSTSFCTGDSVTLSAPTGAGLTYHWSNSAVTSSIKVFTGATYSVTVTNSGSCSASSSVTVTVVGPPTATITPNGATTFCNGGSVVLQANTGAGLSYLWTGGSTATSITVTTSGTYTVTVSNSGCSRVATPVTVTVNPGPTVHITATAITVCAGHSDTLTASGATTYAWSGANLNTTTGTTVIATPTTTTIYTVTGTTSGCIGTAVDTVNVNGSITTVSTTTPTICSGSSAVLNASGATTYSWSPSGTLNTSTGPTVTASPLTLTTYTVTGTSGTCSSTATVTINVNTTVTPSVTISAQQTTICAGAVDTFTAVPVNGGASPSYQWYKNGILQAGNSAKFGTSSLANNDSVWCIMTSNAVCPVPTTVTSNKIHMTVNAVVVPTISISANQNPVCVGDSITFTAVITNGGANPTYVWKRNNNTVGTNSATYKLTAPANNDSVWCVLTSSALCASPITVTSGKVKVIVNQIVSPTISVSPSLNPSCTGSNVTFNASITQGGSNPAYQWYKNGSAVGSNQDNYTDNTLANNDSVWCILTSNATCVSPATVTSNKVVIVIAPQVVPSVTVTTPVTSICAGTSPIFTANPTNGGTSPSYQWYKNGVLQGGNTSTYTSSIANNDSVWCVMTSNATCPVPTTATSPKVHMTVNPVVVPTISITASVNPICAGDTVTFTAVITNGGSAPVYQWKKNGVNVGSNSATYGSVALANNDSVWCVLTSNAPCPSPASVTSTKVHVTVNPVVTPSITVNASQTTICTGTLVNFTSSINNGGSTPVYQWYKNGNTVGTNLSTYSDNTLAGSDSVWCVLTSNANCRSVSSATSNKIVITITTTVVPLVTVSASATTVCAGTSVTFTAAPVNGGSSPSYQWFKDGVLQAGNIGSFTSTTLANHDSVWCVMTSNANCVLPPTATSNKVVMTINPIVVPTVVVTASQNPICAGDSVTFSAAITNGGAAPVYQWKKNGVNAGSNSATYGAAGLANNDSVWCVLTSNAPCPSPASVTSNKVHMTVNPVVTPSITVNASQTTICAGTLVNFTTSISNGGSTPVYQWYKNGATVGTNLSTYSDNTLAGSDSVWCVLTSNANCRSTSSATSNKIVITITTTVVPSVTVSASATTVCAGTSVTFTASPVNGGSSPSYQWFKDGVLQAGNTGIYSSTTLANHDSVWCILTSNANCVSPATATSNKVVMTINPIVVPTVVITASQNPICAGDSVTFTAAITNGGAAPAYQWKKNGVNVGSNSATYGAAGLANNDSVWCVLTSNAPCPSPASVTSNKVHMTVNPIVTPSITVNASQTTICTGTLVNFTSSISNGGSNPVYQWYKNGNTVGTNLSTYSDNTLAGSDSVWCVLTSNANCRSTSSATSNKIVITITTVVVPSVTVNTFSTTACSGSSVTFTAVPVNGGTPTYQWYKSGTLQAGNTNTYATTTLLNNDSVWTVMTSNANCVSPATATSNKVVMTINPVVVPTIVVTASQNPSCAGDSVTFTAAITNGGASPVYQWKKNGINVGSNLATYGSITLANNDSVWCVLTSNATCPSTASVNSNKVHLTINPIVTPSVSVTASQGAICAGTLVTFTAQVSNGGTTPQYQWYKNGNTVGTNLATYDDNTLATNDSVWCVLVSNANCLGVNTAVSNKTGITITPTLVSSVSITSTQTTVCLGTLVMFTATPVNGGSTPGYKWFVNGVDMQAGGSALFTDTALSVYDSVYVIMQSSVACPAQDKDTSNGIGITILQPATYSFAHNICQGGSYVFRGQQLTQAGLYYDTLNATNGCDSIVTLNLAVLSVYQNSLAASVCQGYTYNFNGQNLSAAGVYADTLSSTGGCDSIVTLTLAVNGFSTLNTNASICNGDSYQFGGNNLTQNGVYNDTMRSSLGCDSIITVLNLAVHPKPVPVVTKTGRDTLSTGAYVNYKWLLNNVPVGGSDSAQQLIVLQDGTYSVLVTDSFGCGDTSATIAIVGLGIEESSIINLMIYPNPTENLLNITADKLTEPMSLELRDALGRLILTREVRGYTLHEQLDLSLLSSGVYLLTIRNNDKVLTSKRIVKN